MRNSNKIFAGGWENLGRAGMRIKFVILYGLTTAELHCGSSTAPAIALVVSANSNHSSVTVSIPELSGRQSQLINL